MNTKALITTLAILGSSSAAMAHPALSASAQVDANASWSFGNRNAQQAADRDHRTPAPPPARVDRDGRNDRNDRNDNDRNDRDHRAPTYPVYQPAPQPVAVPVPAYPLPVSQDDCTNTRVGQDVSVYTGPLGSAPANSYRGLVAITDPTRVDSGREFVDMGAQYGRFDTIELEATRGSSYILQVGIQFTDGTTQVVHTNRNLDGREPSLTIDLDGHDRTINRITVYGTSAAHATFQILGA